MKSRGTTLWGVAAGLALAYALAALAVFPKWTVDDAFITYRYAENLARHGQLTWNVGEDPVEGYTGVALPVVLAGASRLGADVDTASKAVGAAAFVAFGLLLMQLAGALGARPSIRAAAATLAYCAPFMLTHATSGLETALFVALVTASLWALAACLAPAPRPAAREAALSVLLLAASLVRPEGAVLAAASAAVLVAVRLREGRGALAGTAARLALLLVLPGLAYFAWRYSYYGLPLPNTYYAKWSRRVSIDTLASLGKFLALYAALPLAAGVLAAAAGRLAPPRDAEDDTLDRADRSGAAPDRRPLLALAAGAAFVLVCCVQYSRSHLVMNYSYRFFAPFLPVLLAAAAVLLERGLSAADAAGRGRPLRWVLAPGLAAQLAVFAWLLPREAAFAAGTARLLADEHVPAAAFLRGAVPPDGWLVVVVDAGTIPYYSGLRTVDFGGLNDEFLARRFRDRIPAERVLDYFFARDPAAAVFTSTRPDAVDGPEPLAIADDPRFANYVLARAFSSESWPEYYELVYLRRDLVPR